MDGELREQLAAALFWWSGGDGNRRDQSELSGDDCGSETPRADPTIKLVHQPDYIRNLLQYAEGGDSWNGIINDDIDADSDSALTSPRADTFAHHGSNGQRPTLGPRYPAREKPLPPAPPRESALQFYHTDMSCGMSPLLSFHPSDVPELTPDRGETSSPSATGPATPSVLADVYLPLTHPAAKNNKLEPLSLPAPPVLQDLSPRKMPGSPARSGLSGPDGLNTIQEGDDVNEDADSVMASTERSFTSSSHGEAGADPTRSHFLAAESRHANAQSVSSLATTSASASSSEWRPSSTIPRRKSISTSIFSRLRKEGRPSVEEEALERKCLTPLELATPPFIPRGADKLPDLSLSPSSPTFTPEASSRMRFFNRVPWLGDPQSRKPRQVFGVDLNESIRAAPAKIRISHKGRSTSYRTYPLSVYKCCEYIRRASGVDASIFSSPGNAYNVASLKETFSQPPLYGTEFQFEGSDYTPCDAARLILLYLEELPKPLIPPSVVKSWILLARQEGAIEPPSPRVETGLDFWTEALNRLPTANRNLTKHLLTVFAELLLAPSGGSGRGRGKITEADARQFASAVSRAMFHQDASAGVAVGHGGDGRNEEQRRKDARKNVHPTLALAFLIQKRGEYVVWMGKAASNSKRESKMFLPSTEEMLEWKGTGVGP